MNNRDVDSQESHNFIEVELSWRHRSLALIEENV